jgi:hypothetical protein
MLDLWCVFCISVGYVKNQNIWLYITVELICAFVMCLLHLCVLHHIQKHLTLLNYRNNFCICHMYSIYGAYIIYKNIWLCVAIQIIYALIMCLLHLCGLHHISKYALLNYSNNLCILCYVVYILGFSNSSMWCSFFFVKHKPWGKAPQQPKITNCQE